MLRLAGAPFGVLDRLRSSDVLRAVDDYLEFERWCEGHAGRVCDILYDLIGEGCGSELNATLLDLKRDVYNDRLPDVAAIERHRERLEAELAEEEYRLVTDWIEHRKRRHRLREELGRAWDDEMGRMRGGLREIVAEAPFRAGLVLSSRSMYREAAEYLEEPAAGPDRRVGKVERSLVQYVARTAMKTTPFSTFCSSHAARISVGEDVGPAGGTLADPRSVVFLNQAVVRRLAALIGTHPDHWPDLSVRANANRVTRDGRCFVLKRGEPGDMSLSFEVREETLSGVRVSPTVRRLLTHLEGRDEPARVRQLRELLAGEGDGKEEVDRALRRLRDTGLVEIGVPISERVPDGLADLLDYLGERDANRDRTFVAVLEEMQSATTSFADAGPETRRELLRELEALVREAESCLDAEGHWDWEGRLVYENCVGAGPPAVVSRDELVDPLDDLRVVGRILPFFDKHLYYRESSRHLLAAEFDGGPVPLITFARRFLADTADAFRQRGGRERLNPFGLARLEKLTALRSEFAGGLAERVLTGDDPVQLDPGWFDHVAERIPAFAEHPRLTTCFVQPYRDAGGATNVVLNTFFSGPARITARLAFLADSDELAETTSAWLHAVRPEGGEPCEIGATLGFNANYHAPLTDRLIGYVRDWKPTRETIPLGELSLAMEGGDLALVDDGGTRISPVDTNLMSPLRRPALFHFVLQVSQWGAVGFDLIEEIEEAAAPPSGDGARCYPRVNVGRCVFSRRMWKLSPDDLRFTDPELDGPAAFLRARRWLKSAALPDELFVRRDVHRGDPEGTAKGEGEGGSTQSKPQYVDFRNPFLVRVFRNMAESAGGTLTLEEVLPTREHWRRIGCSRARELVLDLRLGEP